MKRIAFALLFLAIGIAFLVYGEEALVGATEKQIVANKLELCA